MFNYSININNFLKDNSVENNKDYSNKNNYKENNGNKKYRK
jgi:hypothetical protein